jgi:hypothetical protein
MAPIVRDGSWARGRGPHPPSNFLEEAEQYGLMHALRAIF